MHTPHPPRPSFPPRPGLVSEVSDESLATQLRGRQESGAGDPVAVLMARHWQSAQDYAVICLATSGTVAPMVTAASFHRVLEGLIRGDSGLAVRPRLLVTVRDTVRDWSAEELLAGALPELNKPAGGRGMRTAKSMTPENRQLAERSFHDLPGLAQCLLWHTEVEGEPITVPAGLLGLDPDTAAATLEQVREQFRQGCVRAHRELAPSQDCRFYNRLLDVPIRRGGALLPDVQQHLLECRYCRYAAEQLSHFEGGLGGLIAEAVLGWGARRYLDTRPDRAGQQRGPGRQGGGRRAAPGGRHRLLSRIPAPGSGRRAAPRSNRALFTGVGAASGAVLALVLSIALLSDDGNGAGPASSTSATGRRDSVSSTPPRASVPPGTAGLSAPLDRTRLRNLAVGLCLDIRGDKVEDGAMTGLAACSSDRTQLWSYDEDGLLRSVADPELCLDSHVDAGVVVLGRCAGEAAERADDVRYDLTGQGELLPRWEKALAVAPAGDGRGADIVVKVRNGSDEQRWTTDAATATPESLSVAGNGGPSAAPEGRRTPLAGGDTGRPGSGPTGGPVVTAVPEAYDAGGVRSVGGSPAESGDGTGAKPAHPLTLTAPAPDAGGDPTG